jgi:hypothetical protein
MSPVDFAGSGGATEVMGLLEAAYAQYCPGSPGGIRTRDLSLERAAS